MRGPASIGAVVCAVVALGCGKASDTAQVNGVLQKVFGSRDHAVCAHMQTSHFLAQRQHARGAAARRACRRDLDRGEPAVAVAVSDVAVHRGRATATVALRGGDLDGETFDLALIKVADQWKVDRMRAVQIDFPRFLAAVRRLYARQPGISRRQRRCVVGKIRAVGKDTIERAVLTGEPSVAAVVATCARPKPRADDGTRARRRAEFEAGMRNMLVARNVPANLIECFVRRTRTAVSDADLRALDRARPAEERFRQVIETAIAAGLACRR